MDVNLKQFIDNHKTVIAVHTDFNWTADYEVLRSKGVTIKQKVPLKMYLGIGSKKEKNQFYIQENNKVKKHQIKELIKVEELKNLINQDIDINFYSEFDRGWGLGFISCIASLLAFHLEETDKEKQIQLAIEIESKLRESKCHGTNIYPKFTYNEEITFSKNHGGKKNYKIADLFDTLVIYSGKPSFSNICINNIKKQNLTPYQEIIKDMSVNLTKYLEELMNDGWNEHVMKKVTENLKKHRYIWHLINSSNTSLEKLKNETIHVMNQHYPDTHFGLKFLNSCLIGGSILLVVPKGALKNNGGKLIEYINQHLNETAHVIYDSSSEGFESNGIHYIKKESGTMDDTITVNITERKVYINGKKSTSKELPSQTQTTELLTLIKDKNKIYNTELKKSSYSINRYNFESKILIPLKKQVKKITGKSLNISCRGTQNQFCIENKIDSNKIKIVFEEL